MSSKRNAARVIAARGYLSAAAGILSAANDADAAKTQKEIHPIHWEEMDDLVKRVLNAPQSAKDILKAALKPR